MDGARSPCPGDRVFYVTSKDAWEQAAELVPAAIAGDRTATGRLIELTQRDVWRFIAAHIGTGDADDLTQETYLRALRTLSVFQQRSSIRTRLLVIARRVVIDQLRQRAVRPQAVSPTGPAQQHPTASARCHVDADRYWLYAARILAVRSGIWVTGRTLRERVTCQAAPCQARQSLQSARWSATSAAHCGADSSSIWAESAFRQIHSPRPYRRCRWR